MKTISADEQMIFHLFKKEIIFIFSSVTSNKNMSVFVTSFGHVLKNFMVFLWCLFHFLSLQWDFFFWNFKMISSQKLLHEVKTKCNLCSNLYAFSELTFHSIQLVHTKTLNVFRCCRPQYLFVRNRTKAISDFLRVWLPPSQISSPSLWEAVRPGDVALCCHFSAAVPLLFPC